LMLTTDTGDYIYLCIYIYWFWYVF
jgi:hypothetical protein